MLHWLTKACENHTKFVVGLSSKGPVEKCSFFRMPSLLSIFLSLFYRLCNLCTYLPRFWHLFSLALYFCNCQHAIKIFQNCQDILHKTIWNLRFRHTMWIQVLKAKFYMVSTFEIIPTFALFRLIQHRGLFYTACPLRNVMWRHQRRSCLHRWPHTDARRPGPIYTL